MNTQLPTVETQQTVELHSCRIIKTIFKSALGHLSSTPSTLGCDLTPSPVSHFGVIACSLNMCIIFRSQEKYQVKSASMRIHTAQSVSLIRSAAHAQC